MKNNIFRKIIAGLLVCTMFAGQAMIGFAYTAEDFVVLDGEGNVISQPSDSSAGDTDNLQGSGNAEEFGDNLNGEGSLGAPNAEDETDKPAKDVLSGEAGGESAKIADKMISLKDGVMLLELEEDPVMPVAENNSLSISVITTQETLSHGQKFSFKVIAKDTDTDVAPNLSAGGTITIDVPAFVEITEQDVKDLISKCEAIASGSVNGNQLTLTIAPNTNGENWATIEFDVVGYINSIGYDDTGSGKIEVTVGDTSTGQTTGTGSGNVNVDIGVGTGSGNTNPGEENKPQQTISINKRIYNNEDPDESGVVDDNTKPIGYSLSFAVKQSVDGYASAYDNLSGGNLVLCTGKGETPATLSDAMKLYLDGKLYTPGDSTVDEIVYSSTPLGTITISKKSPGFMIYCENEVELGENETAKMVDVSVTYFAKFTSDENVKVANNVVTLEMGDNRKASAETTIRRTSGAAMIFSKRILSDDTPYKNLDVENGTAQITFRLIFTQYGDSYAYASGEKVAEDILDDHFAYSQESNLLDVDGPFSLYWSEDNPQKLEVRRDVYEGDAIQPIRSGVYYIEFTVTMTNLQPGEMAENKLAAEVVHIRRKAELTVSKEWSGDADIGKGATIGLYHDETGGEAIEEWTVTGDSSHTFKLSHEQLSADTTYWLRETVDPDNGYIAAMAVPVVFILKDTGEVESITINNGTPVTGGAASTTIVNEPDRGRGTLTFSKYAESVSDENVLNGGVFQLYQVTIADGGSRVETPYENTFTTENGVYTFTDLPYGTYFIKEVTPPAGYLKPETDHTDDVVVSKTAPHAYLNLVNKQYKDGEIQINKTDSEGKGLDGIEFTLKYVDGTVRAVEKTENGGSVKFTGLTAGTYYLYETGRPANYAGFDDPVIVTIDENGTGEGIDAAANKNVTGNKITINWTNVEQFGEIKIVKKSEAGEKLKDAKFELYRNNEKVKEGTTDENGELKFTGLAYGDYILKEVTAPAGYVVSDTLANGVEVTVDSTATVNLEYKNATQKGKITITKKNASDKPLTGAVFGLYLNEDCTGDPQVQKNTVNGVCEFTGLESGTYYVKEISAPAGYQLDTETYEFEVGGTDENAVWECSAEVINQNRLYTYSFVKKDDTEGIVLANVKFTLSGDNGITREATSDSNGVVTFTGLPFGTYTITEVEAPAGYIKAAPFSITIDGTNTPAEYVSGQVIDGGIVKNKQINLTVKKVDDRDKTKFLPGAEFQIEAPEDGTFVTATGGEGSYVYSGTAEVGTTFVTGSDGTFTLSKIPQKQGQSYKLVETGAPEGYVINPGQNNQTFSIIDSDPELTVGNTQIRAKLSVVKTDEYGKLLPGIRFTLKTSGGQNVVAREDAEGVYGYVSASTDAEATVLKTAADGTLTVDGLLLGKYYLIEDASSTPVGLVAADAIEVVVPGDEGSAPVVSKTVVNYRNVDDISFQKVDEELNPLPDAVFKLELYAESGSDYAASEVRYAISDENGMVKFENVPHGIYTISEHIAPYGKVLDDTEYYVVVGDAAVPEDMELTPLSARLADGKWINEDKQITATFKKVSTDGRALTGAKFQILDENSNIVKFADPYTGVLTDILVINSQQGEEIELPVGTYYLKEIEAPENYLAESEPIRFKVTLSGPNEVVMENEPYTGSLVITKKGDDGELLGGAEFVGYLNTDYANFGANAEEKFTAVTNSEGTARVDDLPFGEYIVLETKAPEGYESNNKGQTVTISAENTSAEVSVTFVNEKSYYAFVIKKVDVTTGKLLAGATFAVSGNGFYTEVTTDETGYAIVEVPSIGTYRVLEIKAPDGYTIDTEPETVEVTGHTDKDKLMEIGARVLSEDFTTQVNLVKQGEDGELLDGASFRIFSGKVPMFFVQDDDGVYVNASPDADDASDVIAVNNGTATIKKLPLGTYTLSEVVTPDGYMSLGDITLIVDSVNNEVIELAIENVTVKRGVAVCKENEQGIRLKGAEFTLYDEAGEVIESKETSASGYAIFEDLEMGTYTIQETAAPEGYQLDQTKFSFRIDEAGKLVPSGAVEFVNHGTEEDPFYVLKVVNTSEKYEWKLQKVSATDGAALQYAEFRILGNGINQTYTTDENGTAVIDLPVGEYMLTEVKAPNGYVLSSVSHQIRVTASGIWVDETELDESLTYIIENEPEEFQLKIIKVDEVSNEKLLGAVFTVVDASDSSVKYRIATDENGVTDSISLKPGTYAITEIAAPSGYNLPLAGWSFTVKEGGLGNVEIEGTGVVKNSFDNGLLTLTLTNERVKGNLVIYKHDAQDKTAALEGARFRLYDENGKVVYLTGSDGAYKVVDEGTAGSTNSFYTDAGGKVTIEDLCYGEYKLYELDAPAGYQILAEKYLTVKLTRNEETWNVDVPNEKIQRQITIIKQDAEGLNLVGAVFALYEVGEDGKLTQIAEDTTGSDGKAYFTVPYGTYEIWETAAPAGYEKAETPVTFTFDENTAEDEAFTYTVVNEKSVYGIEVYKYEAGKPDKGLQGAEFAFTNSLGFTKVITTDADGIARLDNAQYDDYTIREIKAPDGYYLTDQVITVDREDMVHNEAIHFEMSNRKILGSIILKKLDYQDHDQVLDAEFIIRDKDGNALKWVKTEDGYSMDADGTETIRAGSVKMTNIPAGEYTITEVKAPYGYIILEEAREFAITADNATAGIEIEIMNLKRTTAIGIIKMDADDKSVRLEGAEFTLYPLTNDVQGEPISTMTTDKNGLAIFTDLTAGTYRISETKAPYGYELMVSAVDFIIDGDGKAILIRNNVEIPESNEVHLVGIVNKSIMQEITIKKVSATDGELLEGAVFAIKGKDTSLKVKTGKDGIAKVNLPYGEYVVREIVAPDGFVLDNTKHMLKVTKDGLTVDGTAMKDLTYVVKDQPVKIPVVLHKQDSDSRKALSGAEFKISGNGLVYKVKTDKNGNTDVICLQPGNYSITETKAPSGYQKPLHSWMMKVSRDGKICVVGSYAITASDCGIITITLENTRIHGSGGSSGGDSGSSNNSIAKTGQVIDGTMLASGIALTGASVMGLMVLMLDEIRRRKKRLL